MQILQRLIRPKGSNKFRMVYANAAGRMPWRSNMLRLAYADSGSACKLAQDMVPTAHTQIDVRAQGVGKFSLASSAGPPTALVIKFSKSDRVGRRGLSEPRDDFSRLPTDAFPRLISAADFRGAIPSHYGPPKIDLIASPAPLMVF